MTTFTVSSNCVGKTPFHGGATLHSTTWGIEDCVPGICAWNIHQVQGSIYCVDISNASVVGGMLDDGTLQQFYYSHIALFNSSPLQMPLISWWPQLYAEHYMWARCIPRHAVYQDDPMWWNIRNVPEDFALERGSAFRVGRVHLDKWKHLEIVYKQLEEWVKNWPPKNPDDEGPLQVHIWIRQCQRSLMHLKQLPFTFRDTVVLVVLFQCLCLDIYAMVDSLEIKITPTSGPFFNAKQHWMGVFTTDPDVCEQLFEAHIPIWLVWKLELVPKDMKIHCEVDITCPEGIITTPDEFEVSQMLKWNARWYYPGNPIINSHNLQLNGLEYCSKKAKTSTALNVDLLQDFDDPAFPTHLYLWHTALTDVNKDPKRIHAGVPKITYFFPHPVLFMRGESLEQRQRYLQNCFSGNQIHKAADIFGLEFMKIQHDVPSHVQFCDITIGLTDLTTINLATKGKILWDLYEHNFHFELVTLDCLLVPALWSNVESEWLDQVCQIFLGDSELTMFAKPFPVKDQGLASLEPQTKLEYVERFQTLLALWPGFPPDLGTSLPLSASLAHVWAVEKWLALFYMQSFFDNFGCLPIVLHLFPKNPHSIYGLGDNHLIPSSSTSSSTLSSALAPHLPQA
ncbi:hypothetical protein BKA82DRAFT_4020859 [Pisolithus tinctorius]|nr:hypothetical protein BKA82DRAFT_4020859 [Pisolithus tinctorius]